MEFVSRNAMKLLYFLDAASLVCVLVFYSIAVDSPLKLIRNGNEQEAKKCLNYISRFNSFFSRTVPYQFDDSIKICASKIELAHFKLQEKMSKLYINRKLGSIRGDKSLFKS
jgi:hypothetical protein